MNSILWKKWRDPLDTAFRRQMDYLHGDDDDFRRSRAEFLGEKFEEGEDEEYDDDEDDFGYRPPPRRRDIGPSIVGPMGIIPLHEHSLPCRLYDFWMGHTNFRLSRRHVSQIKSVNGVESLDVFTRHRFRMAVGLSFDNEQVRQSVSSLFLPPVPVTTRAPLDLMKQGLSSQYKFWVIQRANGRTVMFGSDSQSEVMDQTKHLEGELIASWK